MKKIIALLTFTGVLLVSCGKEKTSITTTETAIPVTVSAQAAGTAGDYISASGKIEAENSASVSTRMMGYVTKVHVKVGQKVAAGQLLVSLNSTDLLAKKAQVEASVLQATAAYMNAKKDFERFTALFKEQSASQKELDDMTSRYEMAKAGLEGAKQMRNEVVAQFSYSNLVAPFAGEITNTFIKEGDMANPGMPLVSLEGPSHLQVSAMVSESDITGIQNGMPVAVLVKSTHQTLAGKVIEVSASAKNTGGQYLVKTSLNTSAAKVLSGMFVNVQFPLATPQHTASHSKDKVVVQESALVHQGQLTGIYTIGTKDVAILRWIRIGTTYGNQVEVLSGLSANEPYIVSAEGKLYNGAKISIQ
jgi:RND family efflux transporter MFP subunit